VYELNNFRIHDTLRASENLEKGGRVTIIFVSDNILRLMNLKTVDTYISLVYLSWPLFIRYYKGITHRVLNEH